MFSRRLGRLLLRPLEAVFCCCRYTSITSKMPVQLEQKERERERETGGGGLISPFLTIFLQLANHGGYIQVDWKKLEKDVDQAKRQLRRSTNQTELSSLVEKVRLSESDAVHPSIEF